MTEEERPLRNVELQDVWRIAVAASLGGVVSGAFDWLWRGDWGGGVNPLGWNAYARASWFESIEFGAVIGGLIGVMAAIRRWRRNT